MRLVFQKYSEITLDFPRDVHYLQFKTLVEGGVKRSFLHMCLLFLALKYPLGQKLHYHKRITKSIIIQWNNITSIEDFHKQTVVTKIHSNTNCSIRRHIAQGLILLQHVVLIIEPFPVVQIDQLGRRHLYKEKRRIKFL